MSLTARQSTARTVMVGPVLDADGAAVTGAAVGDFKISKNGGAPAALDGSATLTHRHTGHYSLALTANDLDTVGGAQVTLDKTTDTCPEKDITVVEEAVYDALFAASAPGYVANAPVNVAQISGNAAATDNAKKYFDGTGYGDIMQRTTIAVVNSQTSFTLAAGSADDDVYNNAIIVFEDQSTAAQKAYGFVQDYTGSTKTVTLLAGPGFTIAAGDIVTIRAVQYLNLTLNGSGQVGVYTIATAAAQIIADNVLSRNVSNVEAAMPEHCLGTVVLAMLENDLLSTPGSLIIYRTDGTTIHVTKALTTDPAAEPIVKVE